MLHRFIPATILLAALVGATAESVPPPAPPPPPRPSETPSPVIDPLLACGGYFARAYGVSLVEGCRRMRNQDHVAALSEALNASQPAGFSSLWIQHEPDYAIVVAFRGGASEAERAAVARQAHPSIRGDLEFRDVRRTAAEIAAAQDRIDLALRPIRGGWSGGFDVHIDRFVYTFGSEAQLAEARRLIPADLSGDVDLRVGPVPVVGG